jgi:hypothetical protein
MQMECIQFNLFPEIEMQMAHKLKMKMHSGSLCKLQSMYDYIARRTHANTLTSLTAHIAKGVFNYLTDYLTVLLTKHLFRLP